MKKNIAIKTMAFLALFGIIIGVVGTGVLMLTSSKKETKTNENIYKIDNNTSKEEMEKIIKASKNNLNTFTGAVK